MAASLTNGIPSDRERLHTLGVEELRRLHDAIGSSFEGLRTKALGLLAGEVAMITFLFSADTGKPLAKPVIISTITMYGVGIALLGIAFVLLLTIITPVQWHHPPETVDLEDMDDRFHGSPERFAVYLKKEYVKSIRICAPILAVKSKRFIWAVFILSIGIFVVALLKFGSGTLNLST
jgi:hypothetical protein